MGVDLVEGMGMLSQRVVPHFGSSSSTTILDGDGTTPRIRHFRGKVQFCIVNGTPERVCRNLCTGNR